MAARLRCLMQVYTIRIKVYNGSEFQELVLTFHNQWSSDETQAQEFTTLDQAKCYAEKYQLSGFIIGPDNVKCRIDNKQPKG